jgi:ABC-type sugar transport system permease subunit
MVVEGKDYWNTVVELFFSDADIGKALAGLTKRYNAAYRKGIASGSSRRSSIPASIPPIGQVDPLTRPGGRLRPPSVRAPPGGVPLPEKLTPIIGKIDGRIPEKKTAGTVPAGARRRVRLPAPQPADVRGPLRLSVVWALRYMFYEYDGFFAARLLRGPGELRPSLLPRPGLLALGGGHLPVRAAGKVGLVVPLGFLLALALNRGKRLEGFFQAVVFLPTIMSAAVMSLVFYLLFNVYNGDVNRALLAWGIVGGPIEWLGAKHALKTVVIVGVWGGLGNYMVYFLAGLQRIPKEIYESAELDGASWLRRTVCITIPMLGPVLKVILMLSLLAAFHDMGSIMVLTEGGPFDATKVMSLYVYQFFFPIAAGASYTAVQFGYGSAASVVSAAIVGIVTAAYLFASRKLDDIA